MYIILAIVVVFIIYFVATNHRPIKPTLPQPTAKPEDVLTPEGIPKKSAPKPSPAPVKPPAPIRPPVIKETSNTVKSSEAITGHTAAYSNIPEPRLRPTTPGCYPSTLPADCGSGKYTFASKQHKYSPYTYLLNQAQGTKYAAFISKLRLLAGTDKCILCLNPVEGEERVRLSNGLFVHKDCYAAYTEKLHQITSDEQLKTLQNPLTPDKLMRIIFINEFWPTYPDDWEQRKQIIIKNAEYECESCGENELPLHVHHERELSTGGSNKLENLKCLCEECHKEVHKDNPGVPTGDGSGINRQLIDKAFDTGRNIHFRYKDTKGDFTERTVKPIKYTKSPQGASALIAYCYLRKAQREFIIRKMSRIRIEE